MLVYFFLPQVLDDIAFSVFVLQEFHPFLFPFCN
jgi:hypothetical protein